MTPPGHQTVDGRTVQMASAAANMPLTVSALLCLRCCQTDLAVTPPGHKTVDGRTVPCADGEYQPWWRDRSLASSCEQCGEGFSSEGLQEVQVFDPVTEAVTLQSVRGGPASCCE